MKNKLANLKAITLTLAIALGWIAQNGEAHAAETRVLTVAGGCFWCVEADFEKVKGVEEVVSGYTGGSTENPTYKQVTRGGTGHYEAVQIMFNPEQVSRAQLLHMFLRSVDPTDAGGQFCDRGESYRTAIFVSDQAEKELAQQAIANARQELGQKVVTPIVDAKTFYKAEAYHQDYYKGDRLMVTRFGPIRQSKAYERYREACGRDDRVRQLWGGAAPFAS
ncbi:peptide-methionine (S)-S-oxide reductase MsrA [Lutimaribacter sp. EGI FJ00015]|uniref:Peptide-methionine (S)-S-oxide reductase MsrA n=1 Tax=Lutimaribacter degradans TaxID=2945989 RepID=A0ACC5ZV17_9RHOB|nr:peptide-methionine (S)-S-oxide reductase MsrA [Lutimaribacter sp. EGI FJ00013]MCM2561960.1 peptide-methionine (S)-S-oxide reductase MsrA [Lutimaribacter sp. EGI FJ00013]MCO0613008.1 peptide-methionine (S)-S-oxide reductase MsrA [Lutimaribacter sp. EGI FJ00015]MCO0635792.1 peptide-methionine (S)-S-oxide reductase MsrA [Lutimaribacter sp. EGI FJ00014]